MLVAIIGRITGAAGTCMASTVGTAGTAVGIPVTGAPRTSCSNLRERDRYCMSGPLTKTVALGTSRQRLHPGQSLPARVSMPRVPRIPQPLMEPHQAFEDPEAPGLSGFARKPLLFLLLRALQGHLRLHFFQAFLAALAREADARPRDHRASRNRESRSRSRPCHR